MQITFWLTFEIFGTTIYFIIADFLLVVEQPHEPAGFAGICQKGTSPFHLHADTNLTKDVWMLRMWNLSAVELYNLQLVVVLIFDLFRGCLKRHFYIIEYLALGHHSGTRIWGILPRNCSASTFKWILEGSVTSGTAFTCGFWNEAINQRPISGFRQVWHGGYFVELFSGTNSRVGLEALSLADTSIKSHWVILQFVLHIALPQR